MSGWYRYGDPGEDTVAHLNFKGSRAKCVMPRFEQDNGKLGEICGRMSAALCDFPHCDKPMCSLHRTRHATKPDTDFCSEHKAEALK